MQPNSKLEQAVAAFQQGDLERARRLAEHSAQAGPSPQADHLLGLICCRRGEIEAGIEHLGRAAEAEPDNLAFRVMLVRALVDSGRAVEALDVAPPPSGTSPPEIALWRVRAEAATAAASYLAAAEAWRAICLACPADPRAWIDAGRALLALNDFGGAEQAYLRALAIVPVAEDALYELGLIYERIGKFEQLVQLLNEAFRAGIAKERLGYLWAVLERHAGDLHSAREMLLRSGPPRDPVRWHRLRSRIADEDGDAAEAFEAATAMNRASSDFDAWRKRSAIYREELRHLARTMTREWASGIIRLGPGERCAPVFLVGFPRSGTTLLDTFLMGHPRIAVVEEKGVLLQALEAIGPMADLIHCSTEHLERARHLYFGKLDRYVEPTFDGVIVDKAPLNMLAVPAIHALFPKATIIFAQRHPCDAVLSGFMQSFVANFGMANFLDIEDAADFYDAAMRLWSASCKALQPTVHSVVYEQLVETPESVLEPLVRRLGLDWRARMLDHRATASARGLVMNTSYDQITQPLSAAASGRWRRYQMQLEPVLPVLLPWAEQLGYRA